MRIAFPDVNSFCIIKEWSKERFHEGALSRSLLNAHLQYTIGLIKCFSLHMQVSNFVRLIKIARARVYYKSVTIWPRSIAAKVLKDWSNYKAFSATIVYTQKPQESVLKCATLKRKSETLLTFQFNNSPQYGVLRAFAIQIAQMLLALEADPHSLSSRYFDQS